VPGLLSFGASFGCFSAPAAVLEPEGDSGGHEIAGRRATLPAFVAHATPVAVLVVDDEDKAGRRRTRNPMSSFFGNLAKRDPITRRYLDGLHAFWKWARREVFVDNYRRASLQRLIQEALKVVAALLMFAGLLLLIPLAACIAIGRAVKSTSKGATS
jgi:hypothetical protein